MSDSKYDLTVVGATPGGIAAAVRAAREGLSVLLVTHSDHIGGGLTSGLGVWDTLYEGWRAPIVEEFKSRIQDYYRMRYGEGSEQLVTYSSSLSLEPSVAEWVFNQLVRAEPSITLLTGHFPVAVERAENLLLAVILRAMQDTKTRRIAADAFIDATYEGDLAAVAGVGYRVGREARDEYNEPHAGKIFTQFFYGQFPREAAQSKLNLRPFNLISQEVFAGSTGEGDNAIQAYNFRSILTTDPANRRLPERPENYDRATYLPLLMSEKENEGKSYPFRSTWLLQDIRDFQFRNWKALPNHKLSWNHGNFVGENYAYPNAGWEERRTIAARHRDFEIGLIYFLQNDAAVPDVVRARAREWGFALDEFPDNDNFPYEMYIREARRIVGRYVFTEHDASIAPASQRAPVHADSIAIAEWPMDSHECSTERQLGSAGDGMVLLNEKTRPSQIPFRILLPKDLDNLLVTVCMSASHIGWGTIRVEPTLMHIGESAGFAVALAQREQTTPARISVPQLQRWLVEKGVMISFFNEFDMRTDKPWVVPIQYLGSKKFFGSYNAQPESPLVLSIAREWVKLYGELISGQNETGYHRVILAQLEKATQGEIGITGAEFAEMLVMETAYQGMPQGDVKAALEACQLVTQAPVTRGIACEVIYRLLNN